MKLSVNSGGQAGREFELVSDRFVIGRDPTSDFQIEDDKASRNHAAIHRAPDGQMWIEDLGSTNGTYVNGEWISGPVPLNGGETITIGDTNMTLARDATSATVVGAPAGPPPSPYAGTTPMGAAGQEPARPRGFTMERMMLRRSARTSMVVGIVAGACALIAIGVVLFLTFTGDDDQARAEDVVAEVSPSTVRVLNIGPQGPAGTGTGWVLDAAEGLIVTNHHVVNGHTSLEVTASANDAPREASFVAAAVCDDLALIKVDDTSGLKTLPLGSQSELDTGETVVALGFPASLSTESNLSSTVGAVSVVSESLNPDLLLDVPGLPDVIRTDAAINPGNSGGPLVNLGAELVGVNSATNTEQGGRAIQGQGLAVGVDQVKKVIPSLREGTSFGFTGMGLEFAAVFGEEGLGGLGLPPLNGLVVQAATPDTEAQELGFGRQPTLIVAINDQQMEGNLGSYCEAVGGARTGDTATFSVIESGSEEPEDVEVTFE